MRPTARSAAALLAVLLAACGGGVPGEGPCARDADCPAGQACVDASCQALPCAGGACAKGCTLDADCPAGRVCNPQLHACAQCVSDGQCDGVPGAPRCDPDTGTCVACNTSHDCTRALGPGHFCAAHACEAGCQGDGDCDANRGELCDLSVSPGRCVQCRTSADCGGVAGAPACDDTGHCVACWGRSQQAADAYCGGADPVCDVVSKSCVECLTGHGEQCAAHSTQGGGTWNGARCVDQRCEPGCDSNADCPSAHPLCHLGPDGDPANHTCVDCACDAAHLAADGTYCETDATGGFACPGATADGQPLHVCDAATDLCRKRRQAEACTSSSQCGDVHDPQLGGCMPASFCMFTWHGDTGAGYGPYACASPPSFGRCAAPCDDLTSHALCNAGSSARCPEGSACYPATNESGTSGPYCVALVCKQ